MTEQEKISSLSNTGIFGTHVYFSVNESVFDYDLGIICVDNHKLIDSLHLSTLQTFNNSVLISQWNHPGQV